MTSGFKAQPAIEGLKERETLAQYRQHRDPSGRNGLVGGKRAKKITDKMETTPVADLPDIATEEVQEIIRTYLDQKAAD